MSGNNSFSESSGAPDSNLATEYALRVALQTMKERCISLQQRLSVVEEENLTIKRKISIDGPPGCSQQPDLRNYQSRNGQQNESEVLRDKLSEMTKQKYQLTEHIAMVSTENRQLWSRLSQLTKDKNSKQAKKSDDGESPPTPATSNCQKLIRSETFTQHSPSVLIRPKPIVSGAAAAADFSMEDVSLKNFGDYLGDKYGGGAAKLGTIRPQTPSPTTLDFGFLNEDVSRAGLDLTQDLKTCSAEMRDMKIVLSKQQNDLKVLLNAIKARKAISECPECRKRQQKPEMADKGLETDECMREKQPQKESLTRKDHKEIDSYDGSNHINILEQKRLADERDKMCPLCGKIYSSAIPFDSFREHVETHFIDDVEVDPNSIETNFEFVSHTVGNF